MGTTTATFYLRPRFATSGATDATFYLVFRGVSGLFSAGGGNASASRRKNWKPPKDAAWVDPKTGKPTVQFSQFIDYVVEKVLGGSNNKTLPQVENLITYGQAETLFSTLLGAALQQQVQSLAQSQAATREVLVAAATPGAGQIPPVQLQPVDVTPPTLPDSPGGDGGGGGGGGGGDGGGGD